MYLLEEDFIKLTSLYNSLLNLLKKEFINNYQVTIENAISYIHNFYLQLQIKSSDTFIPPLYNLPSDGILSLYGFQICRYTNILLFDFLNILELNPIIQYIYIDNKNDWHQVNAINANHVVVCIFQNNNKLFLDLHNNIYFNDDLTLINIPSQITVQNLLYIPILKDINDIINKYINAQKLGIKHYFLIKKRLHLSL